MNRDSQALRVRYVGPTNTKPARAVVTQQVPDRTLRHSMEWRDDLDPRENRLLAVQEFLDNQFNPFDPAEKPLVNPNGLYFGGDYFYTWQSGECTLKRRLERIVQMYLPDEEKHHEEDPQPDHIYHDLLAVHNWTE
jgi:hypothetical protein